MPARAGPRPPLPHPPTSPHLVRKLAIASVDSACRRCLGRSCCSPGCCGAASGAGGVLVAAAEGCSLPPGVARRATPSPRGLRASTGRGGARGAHGAHAAAVRRGATAAIGAAAAGAGRLQGAWGSAAGARRWGAGRRSGGTPERGIMRGGTGSLYSLCWRSWSEIGCGIPGGRRFLAHKRMLPLHPRFSLTHTAFKVPYTHQYQI
jgi:hypothetical protein